MGTVPKRPPSLSLGTVVAREVVGWVELNQTFHVMFPVLLSCHRFFRAQCPLYFKKILTPPPSQFVLIFPQ